jgi:hypothetical protein
MESIAFRLRLADITTKCLWVDRLGFVAFVSFVPSWWIFGSGARMLNWPLRPSVPLW